MTLNKYLEYRTVFEKSYQEDESISDLGYKNIRNIKQGINNFPLFFFIYTYDRKPHVSNVVWGVDKSKRYLSFKGYPALKIKLENRKSVLDRFPEQFDKIVTFAQNKLK